MTKSDKDKTLEQVLNDIEKQFGKGSIMKLGDNKHMEVDASPSGSLSLDIALGVGGYPKGRTENLDAYGVLGWGEEHFTVALLGLAVEGLGGDKLGDEQVGPEAFAEFAEREVGDVVHGRKTKDTIFSKVERFHLQIAKIRKKWKEKN